jgi:mannose-6-phosphate isomerase-like protein (cupin superfamily)
MNKLIETLKSLGFVETTLSTRLLTPGEDVNELTFLGHCKTLITVLGFKPGEVRDTHTHEEIRLTFVRSGKMKLVVEDQILEVGMGGVVSMLPHVPHRLEVVGKEPLRLVELVITPLEKQ